MTHKSNLEQLLVFKASRLDVNKSGGQACLVDSGGRAGGGGGALPIRGRLRGRVGENSLVLLTAASQSVNLNSDTASVIL